MIESNSDLGLLSPYDGPDPFVFISYSHLDTAVVHQELRALDQFGYRIWYDRGIRPSSDWNEELAEAIAKCETFLVFFSPSAVSSPHVLNEVYFALTRGKQILAVHLSPTELPPSLQLQLGRFQAIIRHGMRDDHYRDLLVRSLPAKTLGPKPVTLRPVPKGETPDGPRPGVLLPSFHYGSVVPPDYFIDREDALQDGSRLVRDGHGFLLVGNRRDGKTSFCTKLIHEIMGRPGNDTLAVYLNLQQCTRLTPETFLEHAILNLVGEMARQIFRCKYSDLLGLGSAPPLGNEHMRADPEFSAFVELFARIRERTHAHQGAEPSPLMAGEFVQLTQDLLEVQRAKGWRRSVIFFDEANRLSHALSVELLASNEEALSAAGVTSVYAASPEMEESFTRLSDVFGHHLRLGPFGSPNDLMSLLNRYCSTSAPMGQPPAEAGAIDRIWESSGGRPYLIQLLAGGSFRFARAAGAAVVTADHVGSAYDELKRDKPQLLS